MAYKLIPKDDYDESYKIEDREIKCYSPKKLKDLYPDGDYILVGETFSNNKEKKLDELTLPWTTLTISECGKNSKLFHKKAAYLCVGEGKYVVLLKSRLPLLIPLFIILCAVIVAGILLLAPKGDGGEEPSGGGTTVLAPNVDALSPDERAKQAEAQLFTVKGVVKRGGAPYANAKVSLRQGAAVRDTMSGSDGVFTFEEVSPGEYNLITEAEGRVWTQLVTVTNSSITVEVNLPEGETNAVVNILGSDTPAIVVGGLDGEAILREAEGKTVTVTMDVQAAADVTEDGSVPETDEAKSAQRAIHDAAETENLEFFDMSVLLEVLSGGETERSEALHDTQNVLEIVIPFNAVRRENITVYRYHDGAVSAFTKLDSRPAQGYTDGQFYQGNGFLVIYASRFSMYAIGYDDLAAALSGSVTMGYKDEVIAHLSTHEAELYYSHDANSTHDVAIQLIIVSDGSEYLLGQSGAIRPGQELTSMALGELEGSLSVGAYSGMLRLNFFNGETEMTNMVTDIPVTVFVVQ